MFSQLQTLFIAATATVIARANELVAFGDLPFSDHAIAAKQNPEPRGYAPRLQLVSKGGLVDSGTVPPGNFAIVDGDNVTVLGKSIDCIPLAVIDKALDCSGESVIVAFGRDNEVYKRIAETSTEADSGCMFGPCFLVFERSTAQFCELFFNSKSGRRSADKVYPFLPVSKASAKAHGLTAQPPRPLNLTSENVKKGRFSWFVANPAPSVAKFEKTPTTEAAIAAINTFLQQAVTEKDDHAR